MVTLSPICITTGRTVPILFLKHPSPRIPAISTLGIADVTRSTSNLTARSHTNATTTSRLLAGIVNLRKSFLTFDLRFLVPGDSARKESVL